MKIRSKPSAPTAYVYKAKPKHSATPEISKPYFYKAKSKISKPAVDLVVASPIQKLEPPPEQKIVKSNGLQKVLEVCANRGDLKGYLDSKGEVRVQILLHEKYILRSNLNKYITHDFSLSSFGRMINPQNKPCYLTGSKGWKIALDEEINSKSDTDLIFYFPNPKYLKHKLTDFFSKITGETLSFTEGCERYVYKRKGSLSENGLEAIPGGVTFKLNNLFMDFSVMFKTQEHQAVPTFSELRASCKIALHTSPNYYELPLPFPVIQWCIDHQIVDHPMNIEKLLGRIWHARKSLDVEYFISPNVLSEALCSATETERFQFFWDLLNKHFEKRPDIAPYLLLNWTTACGVKTERVSPQHEKLLKITKILASASYHPVGEALLFMFFKLLPVEELMNGLFSLDDDEDADLIRTLLKELTIYYIENIAGNPKEILQGLLAEAEKDYPKAVKHYAKVYTTDPKYLDNLAEKNYCPAVREANDLGYYLNMLQQSSDQQDLDKAFMFIYKNRDKICGKKDDIERLYLIYQEMLKKFPEKRLACIKKYLLKMEIYFSLATI